MIFVEVFSAFSLQSVTHPERSFVLPNVLEHHRFVLRHATGDRTNVQASILELQQNLRKFSTQSHSLVRLQPPFQHQNHPRFVLPVLLPLLWRPSYAGFHGGFRRHHSPSGLYGEVLVRALPLVRARKRVRVVENKHLLKQTEKLVRILYSCTAS